MKICFEKPEWTSHDLETIHCLLSSPKMFCCVLQKLSLCSSFRHHCLSHQNCSSKAQNPVAKSALEHDTTWLPRASSSFAPDQENEEHPRSATFTHGAFREGCFTKSRPAPSKLKGRRLPISQLLCTCFDMFCRYPLSFPAITRLVFSGFTRATQPEHLTFQNPTMSYELPSSDRYGDGRQPSSRGRTSWASVQETPQTMPLQCAS